MASEQFDQPPDYLEPSTNEILHLQQKCRPEGQDQLAAEYNGLRNETVLGHMWVEKFRDCPKNFNKCFEGSSSNPQRNRYTDVPAFEETRVRIKFEKMAKPEYDEPPGEVEKPTTSSKAQFMGIANPFRKTTSVSKNQSKSVQNLPEPSDYINANFVSGYKPCGRSWDKGNYIAAQGPMLETSGHFWEMVVQQKVSSIVMTTRCVERARTKCHQYWPTQKEGKIIYPSIVKSNFSNEQDVISPLNNTHHQITVVYVEELFVQPGQFEIHKLKVLWKDKHTDKKKSFFVNHCHFKAWPDHGIPDTAEVMLNFVKKVRFYDLERRNSYLEFGEEENTQNSVDGVVAESSSTTGTSNQTKNNTPDKQNSTSSESSENNQSSENTQNTVKSLENYKIVVHCSAGIGRTGTFIVVDTCMHHFERSKRKEDTHFAVGKDLVYETSKEVRMQRALAIQTPDQYRFCYNAVGEYIQRNYSSDSDQTTNSSGNDS